MQSNLAKLIGVTCICDVEFQQQNSSYYIEGHHLSTCLDRILTAWLTGIDAEFQSDQPRYHACGKIDKTRGQIANLKPRQSQNT